MSQGEKRVIAIEESVTAPTFEQSSSIPLSNPYLCFVWSENKHRPENSEAMGYVFTGSQ